MKEKYKELLYKSLTEDTHLWQIQGCGAADWSWTEYHSPYYGKRENETQIRFYVGNLNFGTCVFVNGVYSMSFKVLPFSKLSKAIKNMKRYIKIKQDKEYNEMLSNIINSKDIQS